jgi:ABC-type uncharacterized transport system substrate-binding protein
MNLFGFFRPKAKAGPRVNNPKIGFLISATHGSGDVAGVWDQYITAFQSAMCTSNVQYFEEPPGGGVGPHGAGGDKGKYDTAANNLVSVHKVNVIVTGGTLAATECQKYTTTIPIVVASAGDLSGLAGSQLTGCTNGQANTQISDGRITTMNNNLKPTAVGVLGNYDVTPVQEAMDYVLTQLGNKGNPVYLRNNQTDLPNLQATLASLKQQKQVDVLYVCSDPFVRTNGTTIVQAAHAQGMKTMHEFGEWVGPKGPGGDLSYGPDFVKLFQRAAGYVDQILNGASPANLPIFEPQIVDCVQKS